MPGNSSTTVAMTFDVDAMSGWIAMGAMSPTALSRGEFSAVALGRILPLLDQWNVRATFFVPGHTALAYPKLVERLATLGHEVAHHGWVHENPTTLEPEEECAVLDLGSDALERVTGVRPVGYRSPSWEMSERTVELLLNRGFKYDSSMMGNDVQPYWARVGDVADPRAPFVFGRPVNLVEIPVAWHLDDVPHFEHISTHTLTVPGLSNPDDVLNIWIAELDYLLAHEPGGHLTYTLHPECIGRGHRLAMLDRFVRHVYEASDVSWVTCAEVAATWSAERAPHLPAYASNEFSSEERWRR